MQTWSIKPATPQQGRIELCGLDFVGGYGYFDGVRFFDRRLDVERLRDAMARTLDRYPMFGGTLLEEHGRVFIDYDGPGVSFALEESDQPCPPFGPGVPQVNQQHLFLRKPTKPDTVGPWLRPFGKPLLLLKLTRFADGYYALGGTTCHVVGDATMTGNWFADCYRYYCGQESGPTPVFSRDTVTALGDPAANGPSAKSGLSTGEMPTLEALRNLFFETRFACVAVSAQQRAALDSVAADTRAAGVNVNDLLHALLLKTFAQVLPESQTELAADLAYDIRRIKSFEMPANYCGNTILHRWLKLPRRDVAGMSCIELAGRIRAFGKSDPESARQDIGFLEREYRSGRLSDTGIMTRVQAPLGAGSIIINNLTASPVTTSTFGGLALWTDIAINEPLPIRMAIMYPDLKSGLAIVLALPREQAEAFPAFWARCFEELTSAPLPSYH